jgi:hypothetical protein
MFGRLRLRLDASGFIDHGLREVDATIIRANRAAAGGGKKDRRRAR